MRKTMLVFLFHLQHFFLDDTLENHLIKENVSDVIEQLDDAIEMVDHICKELLKIF